MMKLDANCPEMAEVKRRVSYDPETGRFTALVSAGRRKAGSVAVTLMFTGLSFTRSFVLRAIFRRLAWR